MRKIQFLFIFFTLLIISDKVVAQGVQQAKQMITTTKYLLFLPEKYDTTAEKPWPLIMFLHGSGQRGTDIEKVKEHGLPKIVIQNKDFPFMVVSPQCPVNQRWSIEILNNLLDEVIKSYKVDPKRVYLTGLSMGGFGTWDLAIGYPEKFAAIAPICGGGNPADICKLKKIPTWVFHGAKDEAVPLIRSEEMVHALKKYQSNVKFTVYPNAGHDSWTETYNNPELYSWFLANPKQDQKPAIINPSLFDPYVGKYLLNNKVFSVTKENDALFGELNGIKLQFLPLNGNRFFFKEDAVEFSFNKKDKRVTGITIHDCKKDEIANRIVE